MATTLALAMRASMSANGVVSGANQAAASLASFGKVAAQASADASKLSAIDFSSFNADASAAASSVKALASRAAELKEAFDNGSISAEQMQTEMLNLASAAARLSQMQREGLSVTQEHASASEVFAETQRRLSALLDADAISEETYARAIAQATDRLHESSGAAAEARAAEAALQATMRDGANVTNSVATAEEKHAAELSQLSSLLDAGAISEETYARAVAQANDQLHESSGAAAEARAAEAALNATMQDGANVAKSVMTAGERHASTMRNLARLLSAGAISQETFNRAVDKADDELKRASSQTNSATNQFRKLGDQSRKTSSDLSLIKNIAIGAVVAKGIGMAADAFMSAARAAGSYAAHVAQGVDAMNDLAQRTGIGVKSLQALQMAAKLSGIDDVTGAVQKLGVEIGQAAESGKTEAFTKLGLDFKQLQAMAPEEQFKAIQAAISALPTPAERAAAAVSMFGKAGVELLPLMNQNLAEVEERMRRLGAIVGDDQVEAIVGMNDALDMVKATFDGIIGNVVGNLAPVVESLANDLLAFVEEFNNVGGEGGGIADTISNALLDVADYFAGIFDNAVASFKEFSVTMETVGEVFSFAGNVFIAVAETLRAAFNAFQLWGNGFAGFLGLVVEKIGKYVSKDLQDFGTTLRANADAAILQNFDEMKAAASNAAAAGERAIFGGNAAENAPDGPARRAVNRARDRMNDPEARAERERARAQKQQDDKAAREAAAADAKAKKDAEDARKRQEEAAKKAAAIDEKIAGKRGDAMAILSERAAALGGKSNEALKANDVRSSEGMAQFLALATGREDPAIAEYRKQTQKLDEIRGELRALQTEKVTILNGAGA